MSRTQQCEARLSSIVHQEQLSWQAQPQASLRPGDFNETYVPATYAESYQAV
jgi:hypothetical protein